MLLLELFNKGSKLNVVKKLEDKLVIESDTIGKRRIKFIANKIDEAGNEWEVEFVERSQIDTSSGMTGNGKEFEVMGFIRDCMLTLFELHDPDIVGFSAIGESRVGVYKRMIERAIKSGSKYALDTHIDVDKWTGSKDAQFTITKKSVKAKYTK